MTTTDRPALGALHHVAVTVSDVEASAQWYERVLGLQRLPAPIPHYGNESPGIRSPAPRTLRRVGHRCPPP
jgi:hypothetical protein